MRDVGESSASPPSTWRRDFRCFWAGESASLVGSQVLTLALPLTAVVNLEATPGQLGLLGAATYTPYVLGGIPAGLLVDRWQRRRILIGANLVQCLAIGAVPMLAALGHLTFAWLLTAAFLAGIGKVFFSVAYRSYLPTVVPASELTGANARVTVSESVAEIGGPGLGGVLVQHLGAPFALLVDSISYLASAAGYAAVRARETPAKADSAPIRQQIGQGVRLIFVNPYLRAFLGEAASYNLCWQMVNTVLVLFAVRVLGMTAGTLGLALSVGAVGAMIGALTTGRIAQRWGLGRTLVIAAVIGDVAPLAIPTAQRGIWAVPLLAAAFFIQGMGVTACNVHTMSLRQRLVSHQLLGRANAVYILVAQGVQPVGALIGGWLGSAIGIRTALLIGTVGLLTTSLFLILSPLRHVQAAADLTPDASRLP